MSHDNIGSRKILIAVDERGVVQNVVGIPREEWAVFHAGDENYSGKDLDKFLRMIDTSFLKVTGVDPDPTSVDETWPIVTFEFRRYANACERAREYLKERLTDG